MHHKVIKLVQSKDEGQRVFPHSLVIRSPAQITKSLLVLWVEAPEHRYPEVVEEGEIIWDAIVLDHNMQGSKVGDYSGPPK